MFSTFNAKFAHLGITEDFKIKRHHIRWQSSPKDPLQLCLCCLVVVRPQLYACQEHYPCEMRECRRCVMPVNLLLQHVVFHAKLIKIVFLPLVDHRGSHHYLPHTIFLCRALHKFFHSVLKLFFALVVFRLTSIHPLFHQRIKRALHAFTRARSKFFHTLMYIHQLLLLTSKFCLEVLIRAHTQRLTGPRTGISCTCPRTYAQCACAYAS